jgi:hypothetical protein
MYVEAVNEALRGIPPEKVRFHTCYGINEGPRIHEAAMADVVGFMLDVNAGSYSFEAVRTPFFAPNVFKAGKAMAETRVTYCIQIDPENGVCYGLGEVQRQQTHFHRL